MNANSVLAVPKLSIHLEQNALGSFEFICDFYVAYVSLHCFFEITK